MKRSVINILDLSVEELDELIATANDIIENPKKYSEKCRGLKLATLFFEQAPFLFHLPRHADPS